LTFPGLDLQERQALWHDGFRRDPSSAGIIFDLTLAGKEDTLFSFDNRSGSYPESGVVFDNGGDLFVTT
jgi:hypothetical protein